MRRTPATTALARWAPGVLAAAGLVIVGSGCTATPHYSSARTYYVSANGDDHAAGTSTGKAWRTLGRAEGVALHPGDRLLLEGGSTFAGTITLKHGEAGRADKPVVIGSYGNGRATVRATGTAAVSLHDTAGVDIHDLDLVGKGSAYRNQSGINLFSDRTDGKRYDHVTITGVDVSGFQAGIGIGAAHPGGGFADVTVRHANLHANKDAGLLTYGPDYKPEHPSYAHENITVENIDTHDNPGDPQDVHGNGGNGVVFGGVRHATLRDSTAHDNGTRAAATSKAGPVGIWAYNSTQVLIEHNTAYRNHTGGRFDGAGFGLDSNVSASTLQYNLSFGNDGPGYYAYQRWANGAYSGNTIRYNISSDDGRKLPAHGALAVHGIDVRNLAIYQNTLIATPSPRGVMPAVRLEFGERAVALHNNLLVTAGTPLVQADKVLTPANVVLQGNNYRAPDGRWTIKWGDTSYSALAPWRAAIGQERIGNRGTGYTLDPCLSGGALPTIRSADGAHLVVPNCSTLTGKGIDLKAFFDLSPGSVDYFGKAVGTPPPIGAVLPVPR